MVEPTVSTPIAYSYVRFSHPSQAEGDSLRRQSTGAAEWCKANGVRLDTSLTLRDLGVSAFRGKHRDNPEKHALAAFLKLAERGRVPKGSYLIIENLDRLSREHERAALRLWMDILDAGVNIVQLNPETIFRHEHENSDMFDVMRAIMELSRGHSESARKSERVGAAWAERRRRTREGSEIMTRRLPAWVEDRDGTLRLIPERAAVVKRIFTLSTSGYGLVAIVRKLIAEGARPFGGRVAVADEGGKARHKADGGTYGAGYWTRTYIHLILRDRRAVGEYQPRRRRDGKPDGAPIPNYYPAVVTEEEWLAAQGGITQRRRAPGRVSTETVNLFAGLLRDAIDGGTYHAATRIKLKGRGKFYRNTASGAGRAPTRSFSFDAFEKGVLSMLREIDPAEILGTDGAPNDVLVLTAQQTELEGQLAELEAELEKGHVATVAKVARKVEGRLREVAEQLADARQRAASPLGDAWGEAQSIISALEKASDKRDARLRLKAALRRVLDSIWLIVFPRGKERYAAVQVWFAGGERKREYVIYHRAAIGHAKGREEAKWRAKSLSLETVAEDIEETDFRDPTQARRLAAVLAAEISSRGFAPFK